MRRFYIPDWLPGRERRWAKRHRAFMESITPEQRQRLEELSVQIAGQGLTVDEAKARIERAMSSSP